MPEFVTIASYDQLPEALVARSKLEGAGIPCFLANEHLVGTNALYAGAVGGVELRVRGEDIPAALELLAEEEPRAPGAEAEETRCPRCGGTKTASVHVGRALMFFSALIGVPAPLSGKRLRCKECGYAWWG